MRSAGTLAAWAPITRLSTVTTRPKPRVTGLLSVLKIARLTAAAKARQAGAMMQAETSRETRLGRHSGGGLPDGCAAATVASGVVTGPAGRSVTAGESQPGRNQVSGLYPRRSRPAQEPLVAGVAARRPDQGAQI